MKIPFVLSSNQNYNTFVKQKEAKKTIILSMKIIKHIYFLVSFIMATISSINPVLSTDTQYIIVDTYQNFEDARLNRAKLSSLSRATIVELSPKKKKKKNIAVNALRVIQQTKLQEHFYEYRNITKKKTAKKTGLKIKYSVLLGPENKERIEKLANILTNLEYSNFQIVVKNSKMEIKEDKDNNSNYLTIDPKDFNLPDIEEEKMPSLQK